MRKLLLNIFFLSFTFVGFAQRIDGKYFALELNGLTVDTSGKVDFYMIDSFPNEKWFYEVNVTIRGNTIMIDKYPINYDSLGKKWYSASDGGFLTYKGTITRLGDTFIATTRLTAFDYIGFSHFEPPSNLYQADADYIDTSMKHIKKPTLQKLRKTYDVTKMHGIEEFLPKGTLRHDFVIRQEKNGLWINNEFYYRRKKQSI